jgi:hypothetical protein
MKALWASLVVLVLLLCTTVGCSHCPIHRMLFGSGEKEAAAAKEAPAQGEQAATDLSAGADVGR